MKTVKVSHSHLQLFTVPLLTQYMGQSACEALYVPSIHIHTPWAALDRSQASWSAALAAQPPAQPRAAPNTAATGIVPPVAEGRWQRLHDVVESLEPAALSRGWP